MSAHAPPPPPDPTPVPVPPARRPSVDAASAKRLLQAALGSATTLGGSATWEPPPVEELRPLFAKYKITRLIGRGGMGAVYLGTDPTLDRPVAIKILPPELNAIPGFPERFRREAWALAQLHHPHIVQIHEFGITDDGHQFFVMEYVEGTNLAELLANRKTTSGATVPFPPGQALEIACQVCDALACTHAQDILHRDIKPANLLMDAAGHIKLVDFGLARTITKTDPPSQLTGTGDLIGSRDYMAPELLNNQELDARVDVYAVGVLLYEMLTGEVPRGAFQPPSTAQPLDRRLDAIILKAMQSAPDRRFAGIGEMRGALSPLLKTGGRPRPRWLAASVVFLTVVGAAVAVLVPRPPGKPAPRVTRTGLIFEESFDYPAGGDAMNRTNRFSSEGLPLAAGAITEPGLTYTDAYGFALETRGQAAFLDTGDEPGNISHVTPLVVPAGDEKEMWISFIARQTSGSNQRFFNLCLRAADDTCQPPDKDGMVDEVLAIGMRSQLGPQAWQIWDRSTTGAFSRAAVSFRPTMETAFLLVRWERDAVGANERATLWVNPPLSRPPEAASGFSYTSVDSDITHWSDLRELRLGAGHSPDPAQSTSWLIDEIRLGWTREAVTPHRPPPAQPGG